MPLLLPHLIRRPLPFSILNALSSSSDNNGPYTPPQRPHSPTSSYSSDLNATGDFNTICQINSTLTLNSSPSFAGNRILHILPNIILNCPIPRCEIVAKLSGNNILGHNAAIVVGMVRLHAYNISVELCSPKPNFL